MNKFIEATDLGMNNKGMSRITSFQNKPVEVYN